MQCDVKKLTPGGAGLKLGGGIINCEAGSGLARLAVLTAAATSPEGLSVCNWSPVCRAGG